MLLLHIIDLHYIANNYTVSEQQYMIGYNLEENTIKRWMHIVVVNFCHHWSPHYYIRVVSVTLK